MSAPRPWHTESTRTILELRPWFSVVEDTVRLPSGRVIDDYYRIEAPDYVLICARDAQGRVLMERHYKQCLGRTILTSPAGGVDPGETPLEAAQRELLEETGFRAQQWTPLGSFVVDGTRGICTAHLFAAGGLQRAADPVADEMEEFELLFLSAEAVRGAVRDGEIPLLPDIALLSATLGQLLPGHR